MQRNKAIVCWSLASLLAPLLGGFDDVAAQGYPDKPVRLIVPAAPGGSTDQTGRIIAEALSSSLKQPFFVENRPGAATTIGIDLVAKSKPDGYTLGVSGVGAIAIVPLLDQKLPYNPSRDLSIIAGLSSVSALIVARPDLKQNSLAELLAFANDNPEKISYATAGVAGPGHLSMEHLSQLAKIKLLHVPFAGDIPALTAVLTGDVSIALVSVASAEPFLTSGKLKGLVATGSNRLKQFPELATIAEQTDFKDFKTGAWTVLVAAKGTPPDVIDKLNKAVNEAVARDDVRQKLENLGLLTMQGDARSAQDFVDAEIAKNKQIIESIGLKRE